MKNSTLVHCRNKLDGRRSQLSITQATAESTAVSAKSALLHCSSLWEKLNDNDNSLNEVATPVHNHKVCGSRNGCHIRFKKDNRMHLICASGSSSTHMIDVTSDYSINIITK
jgi:hypothetical protein